MRHDGIDGTLASTLSAFDGFYRKEAVNSVDVTYLLQLYVYELCWRKNFVRAFLGSREARVGP